MKATLRFLVVPAIVITLAACGSDDPGTVSSGSSGGVEAVNAAAAPQQEEAPATTAPKVKTTPLAELTPTAESVPVLSGPLKINATLFDNTVYVRPCGAPTALVYDLNRSYTKLTTTVGLDDNSIDTDQATVTFKADTAVRSTVTTRIGEPAGVEVDLTNVLRLRVEITGGGGCAPDIGFGTNVGLGDAQLTPKG